MSISEYIVRRLTRKQAARLRRIRKAAEYLMKHVRLNGFCDCLLTRDPQGQPGYLLIVYTDLLVPGQERALFRHYFMRKLADLREIGPHELVRVAVYDHTDMAHARKPPHVSSGYIAAAIAAMAHTPPVNAVAELRKKFADHRQKRPQPGNGFKDSDYMPDPSAALSDLAQL